MVSQKISTSIDRLHTSMENLVTSIDSQTNKVEEVLELQNEKTENVNDNGNESKCAAVESMNAITTELKKEIQSIKGLLLSPSRFPLNPTITPISLPKSNSTPSTSTNQAKIPDWQLEDIDKDSKDSKQCKDNETNGDPIQDSGSDNKFDYLDCKTRLAGKNETSNSDSE